MKTLDDQVPSGYFEGLPSRTLARLEDSGMQTTSSSGTDLPVSASGPIPKPTADRASGAEERDEDSGLHDIRNLASSARMRLSSKRISDSPPVDQDILSSTSGSWKAVALPEPAKMVSLPEISQTDLKAALKAEKASRKSRPSGQIETPAIEAAPVAAATATAAEAPMYLEQAPAAAKVKSEPAAVTPIIGARIAQAKRGNKRAIIGVASVGLAAAAGIAIYVTTQNTASDRSAPAAEATSNHGSFEKNDSARTISAPTPAAAQIASDKDQQAKEADKGEAAAAGSGTGAAMDAKTDVPPTPAVVEPEPAKQSPKKPAKAVPTKTGKKTVIEVTPPEVPTKKPGPVSETKTKGKDKEGEPDFNDLLKEAGVDQNKKVEKPKLDKSSLSAGDFKAGMGAVQARAQACYNGTQGTASVKLTVAPSGKVSRAQVTGTFAGTPVAACVEAAVRAASFPPWDGGPQSFNYSYLLSE